MSLRELGTVSLEDALGYLGLLAEVKPEKLERAAVRFHGRLETEATFLSLAESQLALAALASLCAGERDAIEVLRRVRPIVGPLIGAARGTCRQRVGCARIDGEICGLRRDVERDALIGGRRKEDLAVDDATRVAGSCHRSPVQSSATYHLVVDGD